jgi:sec-independent protein translocase protein TatB
MFDIGFSEIVVIAVVALIVIGPERLSKTARTLGHLFGRLQRYVNDVKSDISREMELDELRKLQQEVQSAAKSVEQQVTSAVQHVETGVRDVETQLNASASDNAGSKVAASPSPGVDSGHPDLEQLPPPRPSMPATAVPAFDDELAEPPRQNTLPGFDRG